MTPLEIQFKLKRRGITQKQIAQTEKVSEMSISKVISRQMTSDRLMKAISKALGEDHRLVFPEYCFRPGVRKTYKVA